MKKIETLQRPLPAMAVLAALALAGCSGGNIGSSWQCPLAQGGSCDSVAAADPAVSRAASAQSMASDMGAVPKTVLHEPLYRGRERPQADAAAPCRAACDGGFDPFGWLARLFGAEDGEDDSRSAGDGRQPPAPPPSPVSGTAAAAPGSPADPAPLPAEPERAPDDLGDYRSDVLRTEEVVARIWIAPFVDANGVYREAGHVRVVLEPAGWRVP